MKILGREPALIVGVVNALIMLAGTMGFALLGADQAALWVALVNGISAAILAWVTRPISPAVFSQLIGAIVALVAGYGIELTAEFVFALNAAITPTLMFLTRGQVSPVNTAITNATEASGKPEVQTVPDANV